MDFTNLLGKLQEARQKIEESKKKLDNITVEAEVENGAIKVIANANKAIKDIKISEQLLMDADRETIEELLLTAVNKALEEAAKKGEAEMKEVTKDMLPDFPGLA
jgi:hypothetical protein